LEVKNSSPTTAAKSSGNSAMRRSRHPALDQAQLYGILDLAYVSESEALDVAGDLLAGGVQILQLRAKDQTPETILPLACKLSALCRASGTPFIVNDHPHLVPGCHAQGAHVGQDDLSVAEARKFAGVDTIIGKSTHSLAQARAALLEEPDYIGFGPLFATRTKPDYTPIGIEEIRRVQEEVGIPVFCIGGINLGNLREVVTAGAHRVVIVSGILQAEDPRAYCQECRRILDFANPAENSLPQF
jgi:thiamine-phosphate pyrophosphorylase